MYSAAEQSCEETCWYCDSGKRTESVIIRSPYSSSNVFRPAPSRLPPCFAIGGIVSHEKRYHLDMLIIGVIIQIDVNSLVGSRNDRPTQEAPSGAVGYAHWRVPQPAAPEGVFCMGSRLEDYVNEKLNFHFGHMTIHRNTRPVWLQNGKGSRLELDFYIPMLNVAIEVQGEQHYRFVEFFHRDYGDFERRKRYDQRKRQVCQQRGIELVEISSRSQVYDLIKRLEAHANPASNLPSINSVSESELAKSKKRKRNIGESQKRGLLKRARLVAHHRYTMPEVAEKAYRELIQLCERWGFDESYARNLIESQPDKAHPSCDNCGSKIRGEYCRNTRCEASPLFEGFRKNRWPTQEAS